MPHLTLEYSDNIPQFNADRTLLQLNQALLDSGQFEEADIKSRALKLDTYLIGKANQGRGFVHIKIALLSGRTPQIKQALSASLLAALQQSRDWPTDMNIQLCVEVLEIDRASYSKATINP